MFKEYADDIHREQAEEFIMELGKFVLAFERVCDTMRYVIMFMLRSQGLHNQGMEQAIIGDKASYDLQLLLGVIYCELPDQDDDDKKAVRDLLKDIKEISEERNILLHCSWNLGTEAADKELYAATVRFRAKQNKGAEAEVRGVSAAYVRYLSNQLKKIQILLQRLQVCVTQKGFKVSTELSKSI